MRVVHWGMISTDGTTSVYATHVSDCRWHNKARGQWTGRFLQDTGARMTLESSAWNVAKDMKRRAALDALARSEATRLGLPAGPDVFPFAQ